MEQKNFWFTFSNVKSFESISTDGNTAHLENICFAIFLTCILFIAVSSTVPSFFPRIHPHSTWKCFNHTSSRASLVSKKNSKLGFGLVCGKVCPWIVPTKEPVMKLCIKDLVHNGVQLGSTSNSNYPFRRVNQVL